MAAANSSEITGLLKAWSGGDETALDRLTPLIYGELHRLAHYFMGRERDGLTLQTSALINEAYLKLVDVREVEWQDRAHFLGVAARVMRRILVDFARTRLAEKRGGEMQRVSLADVPADSQHLDPDVLALDRALHSLEELDRRQSQVVELRFFGGMTIEETAAVLQVSPGTVRRDWRMARAWLYRELAGA